jgi:hypothetical protein
LLSSGAYLANLSSLNPMIFAFTAKIQQENEGYTKFYESILDEKPLKLLRILKDIVEYGLYEF